MKKAERILGIAAMALFAIGVLFKNMLWPGSNVSMVLSFLLFNFGYLPLNLIQHYRKADSALYRTYLILKFIIFFILVAGFVIKVMHWPGGSFLVTISNFALPFFILLYFYVRYKNKGAMPFSLDDFIIAVIAYSIYIFVIRTLVAPGVMEGYVIIDNEFTAMNSGIESANGVIYASMDSLSNVDAKGLLASMKKLKSESQKICMLNDSLRGEFLSYSTDSRLFLDKDLSFFGTRFLADGSKGTAFFVDLGNGDRLESAIDSYMKAITEIAKTHNLKSSLIGNGLETEAYVNEWGTQFTWSERMFKYLPIAAVFTNLSWIKQMVLLTESTVLYGLISRLDLSEETLFLQELALRESDRAINQKEDEILRIRQQKQLQQLQLEKSQTELDQRNTLTFFAFIGIAFVLILLIISTRAYMLKQKDNKKLAWQKDEITGKNDELNQQNEEIAAQRDEIEAQRDLVSLQKDQIEKVHNEISASIDYATRLQESILPDPVLLKENFSDHFILFRPRDKVSGDFYWWSRIEKHIIIAAADCTGHGVPGAFMSMLGITFLREVVNKELISDAGSILDQLRKEVIRSLNQTGEKEDQKDGLDISLVSINTDTWNCQFAGANNSMYLIRSNELTEFKADPMPISIYHRMDKFATQEIRLERGDQIYLFSDGYADQFGGKDRKKFKYKAFKKLLLDHTNDTMNQQNKVLAETIVKWQGDHEQIDDMVVLGLKV